METEIGALGTDYVSHFALTFDDGPDPYWTPRILERLGAVGVKGTFFLVGAHVRAHVDVAREVLAQGHNLAVHTDRHASHWELSQQEIDDDLVRVLRAVRGIQDADSFRWRPPYGRMLIPETERVAERNRVRLTGWTFNTEDSDPATTVDAVLGRFRQHQEPPPASGRGVILMHDCPAFAQRDDCAVTVELIEPLANEILRNQGVIAPLL